MQQTRQQPAPLWRITRWLVDPGIEVPTAIRTSLVNGLYGTLPIFAGGVLNTISVAAVIASRLQYGLFLLWLTLEVTLCLVRLAVLLQAQRRNFIGIERLTDLYVGLGVLWAGSVGFGTFISVASGDWMAAALACLSAAAMCGGICFRNFSAPRLVGVMIALSLGPCMVAGVLSGEPVFLLTLFQIPFYLYAMTAAAFRLNRMLVSTMQAEQENDHLARHDLLTGLLNRIGLERQLEECETLANTPLTLFYLDLDGFKAVNDRMGHAAGDSLLAMVGERLQAITRGGLIAARIGGDEFVMAGSGNDRETALEVGAGIIDAIAAQPYLIGHHAIEVGVSAGIAFSPDHGKGLADLLSAADNALYQAKSRGRCSLAVAATIGQPPPLRLAALSS
ncbi:GGDEF domain-containing protein [Allosphingosinicella flava]|uniref:GGDEF domain-containing protein n=1 Tax=Allosphingosinicella flava TaxID=2771430 RepID=A0A7T2GJQ5_9SPHN|nr:GGDEF domain-containing protein [Sphingosinicella flava]QPQ55124.1 GGDEF domain-containing protein [Sphingosinicella flava]